MKWIACLSDGQTISSESKLPGNKSTWQALLDILEKEQLFITSLQLNHTNIIITALPGEGYFQAHELHRTFFGNQQHTWHGIGSVLGDEVHITWMGLIAGAVYIRSEIKKLSEVKVHTTMR